METFPTKISCKCPKNSKYMCLDLVRTRWFRLVGMQREMMHPIAAAKHWARSKKDIYCQKMEVWIDGKRQRAECLLLFRSSSTKELRSPARTPKRPVSTLPTPPEKDTWYKWTPRKKREYPLFHLNLYMLKMKRSARFLMMRMNIAKRRTEQ